MKPTKSVRAMWRAIAEGKPELLDDLDMTRAVRRKRSTQPEKKEVQQPLVVYLRKHLPLGSIVHAEAIQPFNENHRFAMQRDGVQFGMPDLLIIVPSPMTGTVAQRPRYFHIECKRPKGGKLSRSQEHTQGLLVDMGCEVLAECRSAAEAVEWLQAKGVLK